MTQFFPQNVVAVIWNKDAARARITRFKGLGEMNPRQLRESTMAVESRRLLQLIHEPDFAAENVMDMLLAKKRAADRRGWLTERGNLAQDLA